LIALYLAISEEIQGVEEQFKKVTKAALEADANSLQALRETLSDLNKRIQATEDETLLEQLTMQALEAEEAVEAAQGKIIAIRRSLEADTPVQLLSSTPIAPVQSDGTNDIDEQIERIKEVAQQRIVSLQEAALAERITNEELAEQRLDIERAAEIEALQFRLDNERLSAAETLKIRTELNDKLLSQEIAGIEGVSEKRTKLRAAIAKGAEIAIDISGKVFDVEEQRLERITEQRLESIETEYANKLEQAEGNVALTEELEREQEEKRQEIEVEAAKERKELAIKEALIQGALGAIRTAANLGFPAAIPALIAQGTATALQLATIREQQFQQGGIIEGASHANGGVKARVSSTGEMVELEGGEAIINKKSTAIFKDELSAINVAGGGKKFNDGGLIPSNFSNPAPTNFAPRPQPVIVNPNDFIRGDAMISEESIDRLTDRLIDRIDARLSRTEKVLPAATREAVENGFIDATNETRRIARRRASSTI
ncbi:MAG: hypothetical protein AAFO82_00140, partial [Bacteroidota bacterium]